jgi:hypothetical protein
VSKGRSGRSRRADLDEAQTLLAMCDSSDGLLLAEALVSLNRCRFVVEWTRRVSKGRKVAAGVVYLDEALALLAMRW